MPDVAATDRPLLRPPGLDDIERHVLADGAPAVMLIDAGNFRALVYYIRALEAAYANREQGWFW